MGPCNAKIKCSILASQVHQKNFVEVSILPLVYKSSTNRHFDYAFNINLILAESWCKIDTYEYKK